MLIVKKINGSNINRVVTLQMNKVWHITKLYTTCCNYMVHGSQECL